MRGIRSLVRLLVTLWTAFEYCVRYFFLSLSRSFKLSRAERAHWLHQCCAAALRRLGVEIQVVGEIPPHGLIVANHLSYLDIMVLSAICDCSFVSKTEVRLWPVFGWMATLAGTVYVDRNRPLHTANVNNELSNALREGVRVVMFPESTSTDASHILPFRSSLFDAAVTAEANITPTYLSYAAPDGDVANDVCYWGDMTFFPHLWRALGLAHIHTRVDFGAFDFRFTDRKLAAKRMHEEVTALAERIQSPDTTSPVALTDSR
jgi:1-acyl-sn-glycerol-3-phosphate acyltransferase